MTRLFADEEIRRYLLGDLPEADEAALEGAYFGDPALLARVELVEHDLADEYVAGRMPSHDRPRFERRLLATDEGRENVGIAQALRLAKAKQTDEEPAVDATAFPTWLRWAAAAVLIVAGGYLAWQFRPHEDRVAQSPPAVTMPPPITATPAPPATEPAIRVATLILTADLARSEGLPPTLVEATDITHVDLLFPVSEMTGNSPTGRVESVEGKAFWTGPIERPATNESRARARIPVASLPPGDYIFSIATGASGAPPAYYYFRVRAR